VGVPGEKVKKGKNALSKKRSGERQNELFSYPRKESPKKKRPGLTRNVPEELDGNPRKKNKPALLLATRKEKRGSRRVKGGKRIPMGCVKEGETPRGFKSLICSTSDWASGESAAERRRHKEKRGPTHTDHNTFDIPIRKRKRKCTDRKKKKKSANTLTKKKRLMDTKMLTSVRKGRKKAKRTRIIPLLVQRTKIKGERKLLLRGGRGVGKRKCQSCQKSAC